MKHTVFKHSLTLGLLLSAAAFADLLPGQSLQRERLALKLSNIVYDIPDLEVFNPDTENFVKVFHSFSRSIPEGLKVENIFAHPETGLKFAIFKQASTGLWVTAIAGTQSSVDCVTDTNLGLAQAKQLKANFSEFFGALVNQKTLTVGHSLGGALAQYVGSEIGRRRLALGLPLADAQLVTWNAFGAESMIKAMGKFDSDLAALMPIANYYVESDYISRIGIPFGPQLQLWKPEVAPSKLRNLLAKSGASEAYSHLIGTIERADRATDGECFLKAEVKAAPPLDRVNSVCKLAPWFALAPKGFYYKRRELIQSKLVRALNDIATYEVNDEAAQGAFMLLRNLALEEIAYCQHAKLSERAEELQSAYDAASKRVVLAESLETPAN